MSGTGLQTNSYFSKQSPTHRHKMVDGLLAASHPAGQKHCALAAAQPRAPIFKPEQGQLTASGEGNDKAISSWGREEEEQPVQ